MIVTILVEGALSNTLQAFRSRFLVNSPSEQAAIDAVHAELDWSDAAHYRVSAESSKQDLDAPNSPLEMGQPVWLSA